MKPCIGSFSWQLVWSKVIGSTERRVLGVPVVIYIQDIGIRTEILWVDTCKHCSYSHTNNSRSHKVYQQLSDTLCHYAVIGFGVGNTRKARVSFA